MEEDLMSGLIAPRTSNSIIMVIGVGGAGGNAVNHMCNVGIEGVDFMVCNTDQQALDMSSIELKVRLGQEGLGAGNVPENGRKAAIESIEEIKHHLESSGTKMVFITAGMGGGTGTGASPIIAKLAQEMGLLTVAVVTSPLAVEGKTRYDQAFKGIDEIDSYVDSLLVINNENISEMYGRLSLKQAFGKADDILSQAVKGIAEIITVGSDLVNVDFADVDKVMRNSGRAHMTVASARGEDRAEMVSQLSLESPLLDQNRIAGAKEILLNISVSPEEELLLDEVTTILKYIQEKAKIQDADGVITDANIIWGTTTKAELDGAMELVVIATGFAKTEVGTSKKSSIIPPGEKNVVNPVPQPILEPIKPIIVKIESPELGHVILGAKSNRYKNIEDELLSKPAYMSGDSKFTEMTAGRKKIFKDKSDDSSTDESKDISLFD